MTGSGQTDALIVERSGGFAGLTMRASLPVLELSPQELAALDDCLGKPAEPPGGPDRFVYRLRLGDREAIVQEEQLPPALRPLLLERLANSWH